ncbi:glutaredoxin domain-containing protein [Acidithiobacillus ferriphilus]|uniref:glutaredoxin domain-containing protein n=1 Tax=Acidithiobacillus TaxID=119977 RepID=UPI003AEFBB00
MVDGLRTDCQEILTVPETDITIYTTPCCTDCEAIKRYLQELGSQYVESELDTPLPGVVEDLEKDNVQSRA